MARKKVEEKREEEEDRVGEGCCGLTVCKYTLCVYNFIFLVSIPGIHHSIVYAALLL